MRRYRNLNASKALIWRIVHRSNLPWILKHGLHASGRAVQAPDWVSIGSAELIRKRATRRVPQPPGGTLSDYVPFYFTPFSPMFLNIHTGRNGIQKRNNCEIVILVASLPDLAERGVPFLFTNGHAYCQWVDFHSDLSALHVIDWELLQSRNFSHDPDDPRRSERYQAEALIHRGLPADALLGIVCYTDALKKSIQDEVHSEGLDLPVHVRRNWYFE